MHSKEITSRVHSIKNVSLKKISEMSMAKQNLETVSRRLTERSKRVSRVSKSQNIYQVSTSLRILGKGENEVGGNLMLR